jgi:hypothetical protein
MKLSVTSRAFLAGGLLIGGAIASVGAQALGPGSGQVVLRSDNAVYLIANGQRRWVATVAITDDELNAYPEAEPIYTGLTPLGSQPTTASAPAPTNPQAANPPTTSSGAATSPSTGTTASTGTSPSTGTTTSTGTSASTGTTPTGATGQADPELPIEVDIAGTPKFEPNERIVLDVKTKTGAACELAVKWPNGTEVNQDKKTADSRGRCHYSIQISASATAGTGSLKGIVRDGGRESRQDVEFEIIPTI